MIITVFFYYSTEISTIFETQIERICEILNLIFLKRFLNRSVMVNFEYICVIVVLKFHNITQSFGSNCVVHDQGLPEHDFQNVNLSDLVNVVIQIVCLTPA